MEMINAIGRRKSAVARVYLTEGTGNIFPICNLAVCGKTTTSTT